MLIVTHQNIETSFDSLLLYLVLKCASGSYVASGIEDALYHVKNLRRLNFEEMLSFFSLGNFEVH
jgi:hypothetical protein